MVNRAVLVQIPHHVLLVTQAHQLEPPIIAMLGEWVEIAIDPAVRALTTNERISDPKLRSPKSDV